MTYLSPAELESMRQQAEIQERLDRRTWGRTVLSYLIGLVVGVALGFCAGEWRTWASINKGHMEALSDHMLYMQRNGLVRLPRKSDRFTKQ